MMNVEAAFSRFHPFAHAYVSEGLILSIGAALALEIRLAGWKESTVRGLLRPGPWAGWT